MAQVYTDLGPGEIIASETVRGRTQHKVAGAFGEKWFDESDLGITRTADAFAWRPPQGGYGEPSHYEHPNDDPSTQIGYGDAYGYSQAEDEQNHWENDPGYQEHIHGPGHGVYQQNDPTFWDEIERNNPDRAGSPESNLYHGYRQAWAPVDHDNSVNLPYDPTPQYPAIPGDTESTLQPIHEIDADERLSPADSITFEDREEEEGGNGVGMFSDNFAKAAGMYGEQDGPRFESDDYDFRTHGSDGKPLSYFHDDVPLQGTPNHPGVDMGAPTPHQTGPHGLGINDPELNDPEYAHPSMRHMLEENAYERDIPGHMSNVHEGFAFLLPMLGLGGGAAAGAGAAGAGAAGAAGAGGMGAAAGGLARGMAGDMAADALMGGGGGDPAQQAQGAEGQLNQAVDAAGPGPGWGELQRGAMNSWLDSRKVAGDHNLSDRYIDVTASADYHNDPVAQFRHDPLAYISRIGHVHDEPISPEMEHYGQLVESNASIREAAWTDVRAKAMRLRREGRVHVKDVDTDRIYASVDGDNGTYDVMIAKGGAFGGFGGGHTITNWRCACEWGRWAFQRRLTYVGRLCSHGYAAYMEMQSNHMKNQPRQRKLTQPPRRKRADALQSVPQRLVPELVINDLEDTQQFLDVEKDERTDTGPDDIIDEKDIVHFARVLEACERENLPYPRQLVAFLERLAEDQSPEDWKIEDAGEQAGAALNEIRDWADTPQAEDWGHMEERNDDIRDAVEEARDGGTDASQLVANVQFRTADSAWDTMMKYRGEQADENDTADAASEASALSGDIAQNEQSTRPVSEGGGGPSGGSNFTPQERTPGEQQNDRRGGPGAQDGVNDNERTPADIAAQGYRGDPGGEYAPKGGTEGGDDPALPGGQSYDKGFNDAGGWQQNETTDPIGQGEYKIQQGDTLADIAQRAGYGDDYNSLAQQNNISNPDLINAGGTLNIGKPGEGGQPAAPAAPGAAQQQAPQATDSPNTNVPGGPLNQNSGGLGADAPAAAPAAPTPAPAAPAAPGGDLSKGTNSAPGAPKDGLGTTSTPKVDTSAVPGGSPGGSNTTGTADTSVAGGGQGGAQTPAPASDTGTPSATTDSANQSSANDAMSQASEAIGTGMDMANSVMNMFGGKYAIFADQADYDEWQKFAYPHTADGPYRPGEHQPFAGSGPQPPLEFSTSEEYADKARKNHDDVTDLEKHNVEYDGTPRQSGIKRAGRGATRHVEPVVVREQKPTQGGHQTIAAHDDGFADFDPFSRTAADFEDPYEVESAAVRTAATGGDFVAEFQRNFGASIMNGGSGGGGGQFDDISSSPVYQAAMQRTAGRNYSPAEQAELIREGDIGGARNLDQLQLAGTHYDESKNSVGLW